MSGCVSIPGNSAQDHIPKANLTRGSHAKNIDGGPHSEHAGQHGCDRTAVSTILLGIGVTVAVLSIVIAIVVAVTEPHHVRGPTACPALKRAIYDLLNTERVVHARFGFYFSTTRENGHEAPESGSHVISVGESDLKHANTIVQRNAEHMFPAHGHAVYVVAAAAWHLMNKTQVVNTPVLYSTNGELCLLGRGDSLLSVDDLRHVVADLKAANISRINNLIVDDQLWKHSSIIGETLLPISPVIINRGTVSVIASSEEDEAAVDLSLGQDDVFAPCITLINRAKVVAERTNSSALTVTPVPGTTTLIVSGTISRGQTVILPTHVLDSASLMTCTLKTLLENAGVVVQNSSIGSCSSGSRVFTRVAKHSIRDIIFASLEPQSDIHAETLLRLLGESQDISGTKDYARVGLDAVKHFVTHHLKVEPDQWHLTTGSGIQSASDFITPELLVAVSRYFSPDSGLTIAKESPSHPIPIKDTIGSILSLAGQRGLLQHRYQGTELTGYLWAHVVESPIVNSLSGWMESKQGNVYFSVIHEHWIYDVTESHSIMDQLILDVATKCKE